MKKHYLLFAGMLTLATSVHAQVSLPRAVYTLDFEGATSVEDLNAKQVGDGELRVSSDPNFGTYYQNAPNAASATPGTNYLIVTQTALGDAASKTKDGCVSLGFWVNPTVANTQYPNINTFYSVLFTLYNNASIGDLTWPMFSVNKRLWMQINTAGAWDDFGDAENVNGTNLVDVTWLDQHMEDQEAQTEAGEDTIISVSTPFDDNWHYVGLSFNSQEGTTSLFVDAELKNKWVNKDGFYGTEDFLGQLKQYKYDYLVLGGVAQWHWNDPDPAFAYDDFTVYAGELTSAQQELVMKIKSGQVDDDTRLAVAQSEYLAAMSEYEDFSVELGNYGTLAETIGDQVMTIDDALYDSPTIEGYKEGAKQIIALVELASSIVKGIDATRAAIETEKEYAASTSYPGFDTYLTALNEAETLMADPTTTEEVNNANTLINKAKVAYVTSQEIPSDGTGINITAIVLHPWFCNPDAEPTGGDGVYAFPYAESHSYANNTTPSDYNSTGWVNGNTFSVDDARVNWTEGRICWNDWHAKSIAGTLDIHQDLINLPAGYYSVSADLVSNVIGDQHTYALSNGVKKVSAPLNYDGWGAENWTTLSTDKVYVGEDGTLTIGTESTATGVAYAGFFCVTNFVLTYYGTEVDLTADLKAKEAEVEEVIAQLLLTGDKTNAEKKVEEIAAGDNTYNAIAQLTDLISEINATIATEQSFTAADDLNTLASQASSTNVKAVYNAGSTNIATALSAETATVDDLPALNALASAIRAYAAVLASAEEWNDATVTALYTEQIAGISTADEPAIAGYTDALLSLMKSTITGKDATETSPVDITFALNNASFSTDNAEGWTISMGTQGVAYQECEFFNQNFNINQAVTGLPTGYYRVAVQGFYRDGTCEEAYNKANTEPEQGEEAIEVLASRRYAGSNVLNAMLYANNGSFDNTTPIMSWAAFNTTGVEFNGYWSPNASDETVDAEHVIYFANTMEAANYLFNAGQNPDGNVVDIYLEEGNTLTVGIYKFTTIANDWTIFDNFHLYYLGTDTPTGIEAPKTVNGSSQIADAEYYDLSGARIVAPAKGVNIMSQRMADGTVRTVKVLVK
ncbi:MAG: hypothetical protein IKH26_06690 [Bacteroidaceae bacterium]|nr:hypothetical protein [Bacteroidaceae bacterium]